MVYLFAGDKRQAQACIKRLKLHPSEAAYIESADWLRGLKQIHVICCGTYLERDDYSAIREALTAAQASLQFVEPFGPSE